ncbi:MAG: hybrid sensor histidine kinase/response regulator [Candidatus Kapabacteria bacterium]|jgi:signal transduction histidine kinase|nr:hybrid sensor histidine kinase/response regulator [Candidatus Kapabacteria bacterium]
MLRIKSPQTELGIRSFSPTEQQYPKEEQRLLIVDDEKDILLTLKELFSPFYTVRTAASGTDALAILESGFIPQVILADQRMPGMSGTEFLHQTITFVPQTVRVVLTGYTDVKDLTDSINQGNVYRFLTKPWRNADLLEIIRVCFEHYYLSEEKIALTRALERVEYVSKEKSELLSIVAHDLKNPIGIIANLADSIVNTPANDSEIANLVKHATDILAVTERMNKLINNLLNIQAIEDGKLPLNIIELNVVPILRLDMKEFRRLTEQKNITIALDADEEPSIAVDEVWFHQILENIVSNAVKYSPHGKHIQIRLKTFPETVQIRISDNGPGIPKEEQPRLFQRFEKLSVRPTAGESSTGIGLSTVKKLMETMRGRVWYESNTDVGSTFVLEFPRVRI